MPNASSASWDGNPPNGDGSDNNPNVGHLGLSVALATFSTLGLLCIIIFCSVRNVFRDIYSPRRSLKSGRPPRLPTDPFTWVATVWQVPESFLVTTVGLDGVLLLRFLRSSTALFTVLSILGAALLPVNYFSDPNRVPIKQMDEAAFLTALTVEHVPASSPYLQVHLLFTWLFSFVAFGFLITFYRGFVDLKLHYTEHVLRRTKLSKIELRSLIVFGIPRELRHEVDLAAYFENLGVGAVENVVICRKWNKLRHAVRNRMFYLQQLERIYAHVRRCAVEGRVGSGAEAWAWRYAAAPVVAVVRALGVARTGLPFFRTPGSHRTNGHGSTEPLLGSGNGGSDSPSVDADTLFPTGSAHTSTGHSPPLHAAAATVSSTTPLLSSSRRFSGSDSGDPSLVEIMNFLDAVDPRYRPRHRTGFMGLMGESVDSADWFAERYREWDGLVHELRRSPERSAPTSVGFVTFESPESATIASQIILSRRPFACMARMAPEPRDVYWPNLASRVADSSLKVIRGLAVNSVLVFVVFVSTLAILSVASLTSLPDMDLEGWPILKEIFDRLGKSGKEVLQQVVSTMVFNAWTSSLPWLLTILSQIQGLEALSWIEMSTFSKYYFYIIYNILLYVVGRAFWDIIDKPDLNLNTIIQKLGNTMPKSSPSMMSYVILQALAVAPAQLVLAGPLILTWLMRLAWWSRTSPRDVSDAYYPSLLTSLNYGVSYTIPTAVWVIGVTYSAMAPLILPFCAIYFAITYFVHKYLLLYVHLPKYESSGMMAPMAVRRCLTGLIIMQVSMMGVLAFKFGGKSTGAVIVDAAAAAAGPATTAAPAWSGYVQMIVGVLPLIICSLGMFWWFREGYEKLVRNTPIELVGKVARDLSRAARAPPVGPQLGPDDPASPSDHGFGPAVSPSSPAAASSPSGVGFASGRQRKMTDNESLAGDKSAKELGEVSPRRTMLGGRGNKLYRRIVQGDEGTETESLIRRGTLLGTELLSPVPSHQGLVRGNRQAVESPILSAFGSDEFGGEPPMLSSSPAAGEGVGGPAAPGRPPMPQPAALVSFIEQPETSPTSLLTAIDVTPPTFRKWFSTPSGDSTAAASSYPAPPSTPRGGRGGWDDEATYSLFEEPSEVADPVGESDPEEVVSDGEDFASPSAPLEPPSTRVPGILDAPLQPSIIPEGDEDENILRALANAADPSRGGAGNGLASHALHHHHGAHVANGGRAGSVFDAPDLQLHTYIHPALIGRLPVAWLPVATPTSQQPRRLREAREDQMRQQRALFRRIVGLQRVGVAVIGNAGREDEVGEEWGEFVVAGRGLWGPGTLVGKVRSFFDGMSSWAHMQL
ncbi:hypothetical protein HDU96_005264 [Phlyctochytrium bullatum]|nr:hypothetical protein HDU96_005264 [Phlyctochytrium bullatum]